MANKKKILLVVNKMGQIKGEKMVKKNCWPIQLVKMRKKWFKILLVANKIDTIYTNKKA